MLKPITHLDGSFTTQNTRDPGDVCQPNGNPGNSGKKKKKVDRKKEAETDAQGVT